MYNGNLNLAGIPKPQRLRAVTFVRVSTEGQAEDGRAGLERQRRSVTAVCASAGYEIIRQIEISDVSGTSAFISTEMLELIAMIEAGLVGVVVCSEMSRIFRPDDLASFGSLDVFRRHGVLLNCGGTVNDLASPEGFLSSGILGLLGGFDRMQLVRRIKQSKEALRINGLHPNGAHLLPLGLHFDKATKKWYYGPEVWKVKEIFRLVDEDGLRNISEIGRRVGVFHRTVRNLLCNTSYIGIRSYLTINDPTRKIVKPGGRQGYRPSIARAPEQVIRVRIFPPEEQAVSDDRFARVQQVLSEISDRHARHIAVHYSLNLLTSVGFCGYCGQRLYTAGRKPSWDKSITKHRGYYICKCKRADYRQKLHSCKLGFLKREEMDELMSAFVVRFLEDPEFISAVFRHAKSKQRETIIGIDSVPDSIRKQISEVEARDRRLIDAIETGAISLAEAKLRRQRLKEEKRALLISLDSTEQRHADTPLPQGVIGRIVANGVRAWTELTTTKERKEFIAKIFIEVFVRESSITAFRLTPCLVGVDSGDWAWVADVPITLPEPFRITPDREENPIPDGHRQCNGCKDVLSLDLFYKTRGRCRSCDNAAKAAALKARRLAQE